MLSHVRRSNSFVWTPVEKPTIENLWEDPSRPSMMQRFAGKRSPLNSIPSPKESLVAASAATPGGGGVKSALVKLGKELTKPTRHPSFLETPVSGKKRSSRGTPSDHDERRKSIRTSEIIHALNAPTSSTSLERQRTRKIEEPDPDVQKQTPAKQPVEHVEKKEKVAKPPRQKRQKHRKEKTAKSMPISSNSDEDYILSSNTDSAAGTGNLPQPSSIADSKLLETVEEELKTIQSRQNLQAQVDAKIEQSNLGRSTPALKG